MKKLELAMFIAAIIATPLFANEAADIAKGDYLAFGEPIPGKGNGEGFVRHGGLKVIHADGSVTLRLKETARETIAEPDAEHTVISLRDEAYDFLVARHIREWKDCGAVETWVELENREEGAVRLVTMDSFATTLARRSGEAGVLSLTGAWASEANVRTAKIGEGQTLALESLAGTRDAWESNAGMLVFPRGGATETEGEVLGVALEWTGTTSRRVHSVYRGGLEVFAGVDNTSGPYVLDAGRKIELPKAILAYSSNGIGPVSRSFHRWARAHLMPHGGDLAPILLNSWEGSYFSFTEATLLDMMDGVREMGGEMFVLDDGWFGLGKYARDNRNRDRVGLGDWTVNPEKLPHGLDALGKAAAERGLGFGLWVEPEMVNTASHLAEAHPDWLLREPKRDLILGRGRTQTVLDFTNPAVRENIYGQLDAVFGSIGNLGYVKWDCNQHISNPGSTYLDREHQSNLWFDYTKGVYDLLARLEAKYPRVRFQACAAGGGHVDFGFLRYADEVWGSDNSDAVNRVFIQWGESIFYPAKAIAAHVTAVPNHQTKRTVPLKFRFDVAMTARLGFELHPKNLSAEELAFAKRAVEDYKRIRPVVQLGDQYRLASPYENPFSAMMYVSEDRSRAVFFALGYANADKADVALALQGLDPERDYRVREIDCGERRHGYEDRTMSGRELMDSGLAFTLGNNYDSAVFELVGIPLSGDGIN